MIASKPSQRMLILTIFLITLSIISTRSISQAQSPTNPDIPTRLPITPPLPPDFNQDGHIDIQDGNFVIQSYDYSDASYFNPDVKINLFDFSRIVNAFGLSHAYPIWEEQWQLLQEYPHQIIGYPDAPNTLIYFTHYPCSDCADVTLNTLPDIYSRYITTGELKLIIRGITNNQSNEYFFNRKQAAISALCAGDQGKYYQMHTQLHQSQNSWQAISPPGAKNHFIQLAGDISLDVGQFTQCIQSNRHEFTVTYNNTLHRMLKIPDAPYLILNQYPLTGDVDIDTLENYFLTDGYF